MRERPIRSGDEPVHARSPLRLRLVLALLGLAWSIAGVVIFWIAGVAVLAAGFALVAVIAAIDSVIVVRHIQAGAHFQPGADIPPYRPVEPLPGPVRSTRLRVAPAARLHRYLALMGTCVILLVVAWGPVRHFSTGLAVGMTLVAMVIPPIAAIVANAGALEDQDRRRRDDAGWPPDEPGRPGRPDRPDA